tara:strand:- start:2209 stop:2445 length:237 start_codon:yes stop_codon:yes gene_type:complete
MTQMTVPAPYELMHYKIQAIMRDNDIPEDQIRYIGEREYPSNFKGHPELHGHIVPWYVINDEHEVPVCDISNFDSVDD